MHTIAGDIEAIRVLDFTVICRVRNVLALLAEASMPYEAAKAALADDSMVHRLLNFFTSSLGAYFPVSTASLSRSKTGFGL